MTTTSERSTALGVFAGNDQADKAIDDLRHAGFGYNQIRLAERGAGSFLDSFKSLFTGQETVSVNTPDDLMKLGVPEQDARYYQSQIDNGRAIVVVNATGHLEQALSILHQDGAYDINARLRTAEANLPTSAQQSGAPRPDVPQPNVGAPQQPADIPQPPVGAPQPAAARSGPYNNPDAPQGPYNPNIPPAAPRAPETPNQE